ncbi:MAG: hypothetical protein EOP86_21945, partial [Verrucomicrobiaceae bacterium]
WHGRSGNVILRQLLERDTPGTLTNVAITSDNIVSDAKNPWLFGYAYVGWKAACMSYYPLRGDSPDPQTLLLRTRSVCLHEIGHNLDLPDHPLSSGIDCCMLGEVSHAGFYDLESYPSNFCESCFRTARNRLREFAEERSGGFHPESGRIFCQRYELLEQAGEGGMGLIWRAHDIHLRQDVALKFVSGHEFDGGAQVSLLREAAQARRLAHPGIIRVFDLAKDAGVGALVMDWVEGQDLETMRQMQRDAFFDPLGIMAWTEQLCSALAYAHSRGVIHQDVSCRNCLIDESGRLILADFGISRQFAEERGGTRVFHSWAYGNPGYSAPEQFAGAPPAPAQDVHGLGATLFYLLTGQSPIFTKLRLGYLPDINELRWKKNKRRQQVGAAWVDTISQCLSPDPAHRPAGIQQVASSLGLSSTVPSSPPSTGFGQPRWNALGLVSWVRSLFGK